MNEIDAAVPGIERLGLGRFQRCRSTGSAADARTPGCVAIVDVEFDGPDADRQRAWSDTVFEAMEGDPAPHPDLTPAHFHVSADGTRVLDYAEWESAGVYADAVGDEGDSSALPPR